MGKLKGKIVKGGDSGCLKVKQDDGSWIQYDYNQPYSAQLGIVENATVSLDLVKTNTGTQIAVAVAPVNKAQIIDITPDKGTGTLQETESGAKYQFFQNYLTESGFTKGTVVKYNLITLNGTLTAVCLTLPENGN